MIEAVGLSKDYVVDGRSVPVLRDVSFTVAEQAVVCIVGPSGAGKSTLLRCLAGLLAPTGGTVTIGGEPVAGPPPGLAVVFQDYSRSLMPWLRVRDNVLLPLLDTVPRAERERRADDALEAVGLSAAARKHPWQLSGGMQQRVALARAIAYRPRLLLMDEPFASVDAQTRADLEDLTLRIRDDYGMTVVVVTHDIDESVYLAHEVIVVRGQPSTVFARVPIPLPTPRDQLATKDTAEFAHLRTKVLRMVRDAPQPAAVEDRVA